MTTSDILSIIAIIVSGLSFGVSVFAFYKDTGSIKAWCELVFNKSKALEGEPELNVYAVNTGKRPVILNFLLVKTPKGHSRIPLKPFPQVLDKDGFVVGIPDILLHEIGLKLEEGQMHHVIFGAEDWTQLYDGEEGFSRDISFEDSLGNRHKVRDSRKVITKYLEAARQPTLN